jgi:hypothetical protein
MPVSLSRFSRARSRHARCTTNPPSPAATRPASANTHGGAPSSCFGSANRLTPAAPNRNATPTARKMPPKKNQNPRSPPMPRLCHRRGLAAQAQLRRVLRGPGALGDQLVELFDGSGE